MTTSMRNAVFLASMLLVSTACGNNTAPAAPSLLPSPTELTNLTTTVVTTVPATAPNPPTTNAALTSTTQAVATTSPQGVARPTAEQIAELERTLDEIDALLGQAESELKND